MAVSLDNQPQQDNASHTYATVDSCKQKVGFACEFVDLPPEHLLQTECPVCLLIIREPYQVTCCGNSFCHSCISRIEAKNKPCPVCNEKHSIFPDKRLKRILYAFEVHCSHQKDGCKWRGELGQFEEHLNRDSQKGKELDGCQFAVMDCFYKCGSQFQRQHILSHQFEHCPKRPFGCKHCHYMSDYDDVVRNHWPVCGSFPVHCPNQCGLELPRQDVDTHIDTECPLTTISCDFHHVGCTEKLLRKDLPDHLRENLLTHTSLLASSHAKQQAEIVQYKKKNLHLEETVAELKTKLQATMPQFNSNVTIPLVPPVLIMSRFQQHKTKKDIWLSPPIYTHHKGYKLCLRVDASGHGNDSHVSVFLHFMEGEFDDHLNWPFRGVIHIRILDRVDGSKDIKHAFTFDAKIRDVACSRVRGVEISSVGCGAAKLVAQSKLVPRYLQNDTLLFQIDKVKLAHHTV